MARPIGSPKTGGRQKGTPNKRTAEIADVFENIGFNVPEQLVSLMPDLSPEKKATVLLVLMNFLYPRRKAVEQKIEIEPPESQRTLAEILTEQAHYHRGDAAHHYKEPELSAAYKLLAEDCEKKARAELTATNK